jgi:hypothetical protein
MSNRYDPDHARDHSRSSDQGRREERYYGPNDQWRDEDEPGEYRSERYYADDRRRSDDRYRYSPDARYGHSSGDRLRDASRYTERSSSGDRAPYARGVYEEQIWSRDPKTAEVPGYDNGARWPSSGAGSDAYHRPWRWRSGADPGNQDWRSGERSWGAPQGPRSFGNYGKGPKGYVRSDDRIREDVCDRLSDDDELDASDITVTVTGGEIRLEGTVADRHSKHRAEDLAESVSGVRDVTNNLRARKGFFQELGDKLSGDDKQEHRGHAGSGTHNLPSSGASTNKNQFSANR